jgi:gluconate 2-dehydrogenase gamma chain
MIDRPHDRRAFLRAAAAAGLFWTAADFARIDQALAWAEERRGRADQDFTALSREQAADVEAMTARIIPSAADSPGAREAGAVHFIDKTLATFNAGQKKFYTDGLDDLNRRAALKAGGTRFSGLTQQQQDDLLREIENTPFFQAVRFDTIAGTFALPSYGGNRDWIGWKMIGLEHQPLYQPPFGWYDANAAAGG